MSLRAWFNRLTPDDQFFLVVLGLWAIAIVTLGGFVLLAAVLD